MTVAELRKALEGLPDDMEVLTFDFEGSPYFLQEVGSAEIETVLSKEGPYTPGERWFWTKDQNSNVAGAEIKVVLIS